MKAKINLLNLLVVVSLVLAVIGLPVNVQAATSAKSVTASTTVSASPQYGGLQPVVKYPVQNDESPILRDMAVSASNSSSKGAVAVDLGTRLLRGGSSERPSVTGTDPVVQSEVNRLTAMPAPIMNFEGVTNLFGGYPPDTEGDIGYDPATGKKYYVQWINLHFAIWDVTGITPTQILGPLPGNTLWQGFGGDCEALNDGDPITLYDTISHRWFMSQFALGTTNNYQCIAVSKTSDPTGAWYRYAYLWTNHTGISVMNDYPHFGVWPDAYYMTVNQFGSTAAGCQPAPSA